MRMSKEWIQENLMVRSDGALCYHAYNRLTPEQKAELQAAFPLYTNRRDIIQAWLHGDYNRCRHCGKPITYDQQTRYDYQSGEKVMRRKKYCSARCMYAGLYGNTKEAIQRTTSKDNLSSWLYGG